MKLRGLVPNFYIHVFVSDLYIPTIGLQMQFSKICGPIVGTYKSFTDTVHECRSWERGHTVSFLGIFVSNFRYSFIYTISFSIHERGRMNHQSRKKGL
jgi:hypothetical protein